MESSKSSVCIAQGMWKCADFYVRLQRNQGASGRPLNCRKACLGGHAYSQHHPRTGDRYTDNIATSYLFAVQVMPALQISRRVKCRAVPQNLVLRLKGCTIAASTRVPANNAPSARPTVTARNVASATNPPVRMAEPGQLSKDMAGQQNEPRAARCVLRGLTAI